MYRDVKDMAELLCRTGRLYMEHNAIQHGSITVYDHSVHVAMVSLWIAYRLPFNTDKRAIIKGALLHDYFLYDWHEKGGGHRLHGFRHPYTSLRNARRDYSLSKKEENIILRHMFPLVPIPPACIEAWIVCAADKYCAVMETVMGISDFPFAA